MTKSLSEQQKNAIRDYIKKGYSANQIQARALNIVPHKKPPFFANLDICSLDNIVWEGYGLFITLISFLTLMSYLASERLKIEREIAKLRENISTTGLSTEDLHNRLNEINNYGAKLSSLLNMLGTFPVSRNHR